MNSKKGLGVILTTLVVFLVAISPALAASPHFNSAAASITASGSLIVSFKESGLGDDALISYTASAFATADYGCLNGGGKNPEASNKTTVDGPVSASGTFSSGKNGSISQSLTINPPSAGGFSCPSGQKLVLADVTYSGVSITDKTNSVTDAIPGTFSITFFTFK